MLELSPKILYATIAVLIIVIIVMYFLYRSVGEDKVEELQSNSIDYLVESINSDPNNV
jgi:sorbitol-specific phosphotransferase system component IIC